MAKQMKRVDAVMVGMGWTGSIMARELTKAGLTVVGLERGAHRSPAEDFTLPQIRDELKYRLRFQLMLDNGTETITMRHAPNETALYEIEFKPDTRPDETIATVRAGDAKSTLRVADLHPWNAASSRMKRASLAAAWARAPQSRKQTEEIVAKAREAHIDELANIAEESIRIR